jgi:hypothetical protein
MIVRACSGNDSNKTYDETFLSVNWSTGYLNLLSALDRETDSSLKVTWSCTTTSSDDNNVTSRVTHAHSHVLAVRDVDDSPPFVIVKRILGARRTKTLPMNRVIRVSKIETV